MEAANACSYAPGHGPPSDEELFARASAVFVGHIFRVEEAGVAQVLESLKGQPPVESKVRAPTIAPCSFPLLPGLDYLFFLYQDNFIRGFGEGARPISNWLGGKDDNAPMQRQLEKLRELSKKELSP
jgi:hypothetical protein